MSSLTLIAIFATGCVLYTSEARQQVCFSGTEYLLYDDEVRICCNGHVKRRVRDQGCCNNELYYTRNCSSGNEHCQEYICCGNKVVDKEKALCCNGKPHYLDQSQELHRDILQCCGNSVRNIVTHFCCNDTIISNNFSNGCCGERVYNKVSEKCLDSVIPPRVLPKYVSLCNNVEYDTRKKGCCNDILQNMPEMDKMDPTQLNPNFDCCDDFAYDKSEKSCCRKSQNSDYNTHTMPNRPNIFCCGNGHYNGEHQDCFNGTVMEKVPGKEPCGYSYIDGVSEKCCDNTVYAVSSHDCCYGYKTAIIPKNQKCCNGEGIDSSKLCCEGQKPVNKTSPDDNECCYNFRTLQGMSYNSEKNEYCTGGEVIRFPKGAKPCGAYNYYYPDSHICCGDTVKNKSEGFDQCCENRPYKSRSQQCCNYEVVNIPADEGSCCAVDFKVYRHDEPENPCKQPCGSKTYDFTTEVCCEGVVHHLHEYTQCCGSAVIDSRYYECCGRKYPWSITGNKRCCGDKELFNIRNYECINNTVVIKNLQNSHSVPHITGSQLLCTRAAMKNFNGGVKYACESRSVIRAHLVEVHITKMSSANVTHISLSLSRVVGLNRGGKFTTWSGPKDLHFLIEVPDADGVKCRQRYFDSICEVIVFFSAKVKTDGTVKVNRNSEFFMTAYKKQQERLITKRLSCKGDFSIRDRY